MSPQLVLELPRTSQAPGIARRWLSGSFADELDSRTHETARLLVSELVTNAVVHGRGRIEIHAHLDRDRLLVEVIDEGPGFTPAIRKRDSDTAGGDGLRIVEEEASRWGVRPGAADVWFELPRHRPSSDGEGTGPIPDKQPAAQEPNSCERTPSAHSTGHVAPGLGERRDGWSAPHPDASLTESSVPSARSSTRTSPTGASSNGRRTRARRAALYRRVADTLERSADLAEQHAERERIRGHQQSAQIELERATRAREAARHGRSLSTQLQ
jgi:anti-sigma regulatory factor (Ser/Thr protein kinase)